jgi:Lrp/AsnC family transcriptional regulator for asnA, asnC and gidA
MAKKIDNLDLRIVSLMTFGLANKEIASRLKTPLSTVQRRTRKLIENNVISVKAEVNFEAMGVKKGMIHVYLDDGNVDEMARKIGAIDIIDSVEIHIGNSDLIANVLYTDSRQLLQTISDIKGMAGVERILWSEEVYHVNSDNGNLISSLLGLES